MREISRFPFCLVHELKWVCNQETIITPLVLQSERGDNAKGASRNTETETPVPMPSTVGSA